MISRESINKLFNSLAGFVSKLTGRLVKFHPIGEEPMGVACEKMNWFFEAAATALNNPEVRMLGMLEPGKVYCLQVDLHTIDMEFCVDIFEEFAKKDITIIFVGKDMNFVNVPEGYEVVRKEN